MLRVLSSHIIFIELRGNLGLAHPLRTIEIGYSPLGRIESN